MLQRVVEFLPIEQLYKEKSHTVKAVSRAWRTAARRALTRGRWKPLRTLEDRAPANLKPGAILRPETLRALSTGTLGKRGRSIREKCCYCSSDWNTLACLIIYR